jgi:hypothetical protein
MALAQILPQTKLYISQTIVLAKAPQGKIIGGSVPRYFLGPACCPLLLWLVKGRRGQMIQGDIDADMFADFVGEKDKEGERSSCSRICFDLLMYSFGLKKQLLDDFTSTTFSDFTVIVINGYLTSINLTHKV